jgi:NTP pyrophosphatase (non-canonical NTP hydrolase)
VAASRARTHGRLAQTVPVEANPGKAMTELAELQRMMERTYGERDRARGIAATVAWLAEEVGELAKAVRKGSREDQLHELGDTLAWLASLANQLGLALDDAIARYRAGCPRCGASPCECGGRREPSP